MLIDGKALAQKIKERLRGEIAKRDNAPLLSIISVGENSISEKYLTVKKKLAEEIGVRVEEIHFKNESTEKEIREVLQNHREKNTGIIVQLPLPPQFDTGKILDSIAPKNDPDMLSSSSRDMFERGESTLLPPVIGAVQEIVNEYNIALKHKKVVVVGEGVLVGKPSIVWFKREGAEVSSVNIDTPKEERKKFLQQADIIVSGAGVPHLIGKEEVKEGVIVFDAGTSEEGGALKGDIAPDVAKKAALFTPTPGGMGPLASVMLFKNLVYLTQ
ncbi:MAG: bifunctional 5,10-methylenetetrahydrofolate dehydrogenase/5,10-methenyltetrahydrofolate cyclohydrolase [Candidatus Paceibacterota bacterium]